MRHMDIGFAFIIGIIVGIFAFYTRNKADICGCLRIDRSLKDEEPYLFLELSETVNDISDRKYVILKVCDKNFDTHK